MIQIESSTQISRPRNEVFDFLTDVENLPKWQSGIVQSRPISEGGVRVGFQFEEMVRVAMWRLRAVCTVTDIKDNERFAFVMKTSGPLDCEAHFDLQPVAGGTRLSLKGTARLKGIWRLLQPMVAADLRKETKSELETAKRLLEGEFLVERRRAASPS
jgi:uncharacterized protein YndB with AHSA1/START domain